MVTEFAEIYIKPGKEAAFISGVEVSKPVFAKAPGCHGLVLHRSIEAPEYFVLNIKWDSVAAHNEFRASSDFQTWRGNVGDCFAEPPRVWHGEPVA
jgi:quinol monooxygenase YgiN